MSVSSNWVDGVFGSMIVGALSGFLIYLAATVLGSEQLAEMGVDNTRLLVGSTVGGLFTGLIGGRMWRHRTGPGGTFLFAFPTAAVGYVGVWWWGVGHSMTSAIGMAFATALFYSVVYGDADSDG